MYVSHTLCVRILGCSQLDEFGEGLLKPGDILSACCSETRLSASSAEDELGGFADVLAGILSFGHEVLGVH